MTQNHCYTFERGIDFLIEAAKQGRHENVIVPRYELALGIYLGEHFINAFPENQWKRNTYCLLFHAKAKAEDWESLKSRILTACANYELHLSSTWF